MMPAECMCGLHNSCIVMTLLNLRGFFACRTHRNCIPMVSKHLMGNDCIDGLPQR